MTLVCALATHGLVLLSVSDSVIEPPLVKDSFTDRVTDSFKPMPSNDAEASAVYDRPCSKTLDQLCSVVTVFVFE